MTTIYLEMIRNLTGFGMEIEEDLDGNLWYCFEGEKQRRLSDGEVELYKAANRFEWEDE